METTNQTTVVIEAINGEWVQLYANLPGNRYSNRIADMINEEIRKKVPDGKYDYTILEGIEKEVREDSLTLLLENLSGNDLFRSAVMSDNQQKIRKEIKKLVSSAVHITYRRCQKQRYKLLYCTEPAEERHDMNVVTSEEVLKESMVRAIDDAFKDCAINGRDQKLLFMIVANGLPPRIAARKIGISKSRLYRILKRCSKILPIYLNNGATLSVDNDETVLSNYEHTSTSSLNIAKLILP